MMEPVTFIVFGATGNLSRNKLLPAMYHLEEAGRIPDGSAIVGFSRQQFSNDSWREQITDILKDKARGGIKQDVMDRLCQRMHLFSGDMTNTDSLRELKNYLEKTEHLPRNLIFYMAIPPLQYTHVSQALAEAGLDKEEHGWRRLVIEKPFGYDAESAHA